ncbi:leucyl aminopeptidase [Methylacidiphilum caldifontis]|uniref:leucyl aminopeptidase n=1 Tax=Methylacidiphilum caldifontis TaxID=2795386 RepID=UPI001A8F5604|nr:leucyl aminopeptidase [Methylacidiphilum caldifontis]QSR89653.1 leucyl aminopeptidase [Methylacidiphilum caldifontis]
MNLHVQKEFPGRGDKIVFVEEGKFQKEGVSPAEFEGKKLSTLLWREPWGRIVYVGIGTHPYKRDTLRKAAGLGVKSLLKIGARDISLDFSPCAEFLPFAAAAVEGAILSSYRFEQFKEQSAQRKNKLEDLRIISGPVSDESLLQKIEKEAQQAVEIADAVNYVRAIGNMPANYITPEVLSQKALELAEKRKTIRVEVFNRERLEKEGFGGLIAVGKGSINEPRLIVLDYAQGESAAQPVLVVGKAITFDSGGISIKPGEHMDEMKYDKMGGCAVLGIVDAVSRLGLPLRLVGIIAAAENMPSGQAYRPGDILQTYGGKTIEVLNTDAEGRIVLADALAYGIKQFNPCLVFDLATLTGACIVAIGKQKAGLFSNREDIAEFLWKQSEDYGDPLWPLPLGDEFDEAISSDVATVKNVGGREGGACTAASFLRKWVGDVPWVHLDIAGPAWITKEYPYLEKGATGFGVRLICRYLMRRIEDKSL